LSVAVVAAVTTKLGDRLLGHAIFQRLLAVTRRVPGVHGVEDQLKVEEKTETTRRE